MLIAVVAVVIVLLSSGGDGSDKAVDAVEARMAADDPAGTGYYTCGGDTGPNFYCYSATGNCAGDRQYSVYFDSDNGTFRYREQAPVRSNDHCDR